nr:hypothetical protein [Tanacetum cinerariifolium]
FKTYDEYKDDWIKMYHGYTKSHEQRIEYRKNQVKLNIIDSELEEKALRNKAIMEGSINEDVESNTEGWKSWTTLKLPTMITMNENKRMNMKIIKDMSYVEIKLMSFQFTLFDEYKQRCMLSIPRNLSPDGQRMDGPRCKEIDDVGEVSTIWKSKCVGVLIS